jgi:hypothetical protein
MNELIRELLTPWSYDGHGINWGDEYHSRMVTFHTRPQMSRDDWAMRDAAAKLIMAAPELYQLLAEVQRGEWLAFESCETDDDPSQMLSARIAAALAGVQA